MRVGSAFPPPWATMVDCVQTTTKERLLLTKELLDTAEIGRIRPRWDGSFTVIASQNHSASILALGCAAARPQRRQAGEQLNSRMVRSVTCYLVRWPGHASSGGAGALPREDGVVRSRRPTPRHSPGCRDPALCSARRQGAAAPCGAGRVLARRHDPDRGLVRPGTRRSRAAGFSHSGLVQYGPRSALGAAAAAVDSLLDAASHGPVAPRACGRSGCSSRPDSDNWPAPVRPASL